MPPAQLIAVPQSPDGRAFQKKVPCPRAWGAAASRTAAVMANPETRRSPESKICTVHSNSLKLLQTVQTVCRRDNDNRQKAHNFRFNGFQPKGHQTLGIARESPPRRVEQPFDQSRIFRSAVRRRPLVTNQRRVEPLRCLLLSGFCDGLQRCSPPWRQETGHVRNGLPPRSTMVIKTRLNNPVKHPAKINGKTHRFVR